MENQNKLKVDPRTIARTVILLLTLVNGLLAYFGKDKIPFTEDTIYEIVTIITTIGATVWAWWENNAFTKNARKAEQYRKELYSNQQEERTSEKEEPDEK